jgi:hypothetical protein
MVLDIVGLRNITLDPGVIINVDGDFDDVTFGLRNPQIADLYASGIGIRIKVRISDSIQPSVPIVFPPINIGPLPPFPIDIQLMDLTLNDYGKWIDVNLLVPCDVDVSWDDVDVDSFHAVVRANPGVFAPFTNGFHTADDAKMLVLPFAEQLTEALRFFVDPIAVGVAWLGGYPNAGFSAGIECPD